MTQIAVEELFVQFKASIELLASPAHDQIKWLEERNLPTIELIQQFKDVYPLWEDRLRQASLLDGAEVRLLNRVSERIRELEATNSNLLVDRFTIGTSKLWSGIREAASQCMARLNRNH